MIHFFLFRLCAGWFLLQAVGVFGVCWGSEFEARWAMPSIDRWMYPFGDPIGDRPIANTWGSFDPRFDTRDGQFFLGWETSAQIPVELGATHYLLRSVRVLLA